MRKSHKNKSLNLSEELYEQGNKTKKELVDRCRHYK